MVFVLLQRSDGKRPMARLQTLPVRHQFLLMQLSPCLNQPLLTNGKRSSDQLHWFNSVNRHSILIISVKVRHMMRPAGSIYIRIIIPKKRASSGIRNDQDEGVGGGKEGCKKFRRKAWVLFGCFHNLIHEFFRCFDLLPERENVFRTIFYFFLIPRCSTS